MAMDKDIIISILFEAEIQVLAHEYIFQFSFVIQTMCCYVHRIGVDILG